MTDFAAHDMDEIEAEAQPVRGRTSMRRRPTPIVPQRNVAGTALAIVIAIMTFLSCLTLGAVSLVRDSASQWEVQIASEATIQIKPVDDLDMEAALEKVATIAASYAGVMETRIIDRAATARLLEPWLGDGLDLDQLPVPRLVVVKIDKQSPPDFTGLRIALSDAIPSASLDDHRTWVDRLVAMAHTTVAIGVAVLVLMLAATVLSVIFATRGAMSGNNGIIEVLHFVGAEGRYIARQFRQHFLVNGFRGAAVGGLAAALAFAGFSFWSARNLATPEADQASALFGTFSIGVNGYLGVLLIVLVVSFLTAATSHFTVLAYLSHLDSRSSSET
ncbi:MAG: ABC transporter permease [Rhizobiaceae bacterium]|nr:ABC transporter permease [Rhizobiaceae bacterium]